jgi:hypothetical protein
VLGALYLVLATLLTLGFPGIEAQRTKYKTQNTKHKAQNTKHKTHKPLVVAV